LIALIKEFASALHIAHTAVLSHLENAVHSKVQYYVTQNQSEETGQGFTLMKKKTAGR
jgi:rRNA processing protein Krr1/Pno1